MLRSRSFFSFLFFFFSSFHEPLPQSEERTFRSPSALPIQTSISRLIESIRLRFFASQSFYLTTFHIISYMHERFCLNLLVSICFASVSQVAAANVELNLKWHHYFIFFFFRRIRDSIIQINSCRLANIICILKRRRREESNSWKKW